MLSIMFFWALWWRMMSIVLWIRMTVMLPFRMGLVRWGILVRARGMVITWRCTSSEGSFSVLAFRRRCRFMWFLTISWYSVVVVFFVDRWTSRVPFGGTKLFVFVMLVGRIRNYITMIRRKVRRRWLSLAVLNTKWWILVCRTCTKAIFLNFLSNWES